MAFITRNRVFVLFLLIVCICVESKVKSLEIYYKLSFFNFIDRSVLRAKTLIEIMSELRFLLIQSIGSEILSPIGTHTHSEILKKCCTLLMANFQAFQRMEWESRAITRIMPGIKQTLIV